MATLRPRSADDLGLRRALSDRLLPLLVAAMTFLAALALGGAAGAAALAHHWRQGAASILTVQVPSPGGGRGERVTRALAADPSVASARSLSRAELDDLLRPWLGTDATRLSLQLPAVFEVRLKDGLDPAGLDARLARLAPGTLVERNGAWLTRLASLAASLQACAALAVLVVGFVSASVIAVATRAGLAARRDAIEILHGLGATDGMIAGRFAGRVTGLSAIGAAGGAALAVPVLLSLAQLSAPFQSAHFSDAGSLVRSLPDALWAALTVLPFAAAAIGWLTAQGTVRAWLARLP